MMIYINLNMIIFFFWLVWIQIVSGMLRDFATCHDDFDLKPPDGVLKEHTFTWLGFAQYSHGKSIYKVGFENGLQK